MTVANLKTLRLVVPGVLIVFYALILGWITKLWDFSIPDLSKAPYSLSILIPAGVYYMSPLRKVFNGPQHRKITEKLRIRLVEIGGMTDHPEKYTWKKLRPLFFSLIDNDPSLKEKATIAYSNGLMWTSYSDASILAILYCVPAIFFYWIGVDASLIALLLFIGISAVCYVGCLIATRKQIEIGEEQLEIIDMKYKYDVEKRLVNLDR